MSLIPSKKRLAHIVFEHDDKASRAFDVTILVLILGSIIVVVLDSVGEIRIEYHKFFSVLEWTFTILFTLEYLLSLWLSNRKIGYVLSFYGLVDLFAIVPTYLSLFLLNTQFLVVIRSLRLLRVIRILKLGRYLNEAEFLKEALNASKAKIQIFIGSVLAIVLIAGTLMYIVEGPESGFTSIPMSMYWAIVTLTTVGFGDITPLTAFGKFLASLIMLMGYGIIAVPTGIVTAEMASAKNKISMANARSCGNCKFIESDVQAKFCKNCGEKFPQK